MSKGVVPLRSVMLLLAGCWLVRRRTKKDVADKMCGKFEFMLLCFLFGMGRKDLGRRRRTTKRVSAADKRRHAGLIDWEAPMLAGWLAPDA